MRKRGAWTTPTRPEESRGHRNIFRFHVWGLSCSQIMCTCQASSWVRCLGKSGWNVMWGSSRCVLRDVKSHENGRQYIPSLKRCQNNILYRYNTFVWEVVRRPFIHRHKIHTSEIKNGRWYVTIGLEIFRSSFPTLKTRGKNPTDSIATSNCTGVLEALEFICSFWHVAAIGIVTNCSEVWQ